MISDNNQVKPLDKTTVSTSTDLINGIILKWKYQI
jgi:hypothetical protein